MTEDQKEGLQEAMMCLMDRERTVVQLVCMNGWTLSDTGRYLGVTRERARQIYLNAIRKLRQPACASLIIYGKKGCGLMQREKMLKKKERILDAMEQELKNREDRLSSKAYLQEISDTFLLVSEMGFSPRTANALKNAGLRTADDLLSLESEKGKKGFAEIKGIGKKSAKEIMEKIEDLQLQ